MRKSPVLIASALLGLLMACGGSGADAGGTVSVSVLGSFQKKVLAPNGSTTSVTLPARYCRVLFADASTDAVVADGGYLDANGQGTFAVPAGANVYAVMLADWSVPGRSSGAPAFMEGYTVNATVGTTFSSTQDWAVTSDSFTADTGTLSLTALDDSARISGAFNLADQGVTFALGLRGLVSDASVPSVAMFWNTSTASGAQTRLYPQALLDSSNNLITLDGRAVFQASVMGDASGAPNTEQDEWDDGVIGETYAHLLFAPGSYKADGSSALSYLRADSENVSYLPLAGPSEPSQAFVAGFSDYLSCAFRGSSRILDSYRDGSGTLQVQNEDLTASGAFGEFSRYGVAGSLWSMQQALGGGQPALQTLWGSVLTSNSGLDFVGDYNGSPLGCYPTYLVGLRSAVGGSWPACQTALSAWGVSDPSATYFSTGSTLWTNEATPFSVTGATLQVPATPAYAVDCYARNGAALYRFTQGSTGSRTITMTPTGGQDFELDLLGPNGLVQASYSTPFGMTRSFLVNLAAGSYVIRVRVNPDNTLSRAAGAYAYNLSLN
ncbi:MAG: hypothetical protein JST24_10175 [Acidobacteria bacterium]|nr:hypothetical protein [Acidobacteriota bacterium]